MQRPAKFTISLPMKELGEYIPVLGNHCFRIMPIIVANPPRLHPKPAHNCPTKSTSNCVIGTMHRSSTRQRRKQKCQSESSGDNSDSSKDRDEEQATEFVHDPLTFDVLCGHDRNFNKHPGNQVYRQLIEEHFLAYQSNVSKQEKMNITRSIRTIMEHQYGSRFLRNCEEMKKKKRGNRYEEDDQDQDDRKSEGAPAVAAAWQVMTHTKARDKISHALRTYKKTNQNEEDMDHDNSSDMNATAISSMNATLTPPFYSGHELRSHKRSKQNEGSIARNALTTEGLHGIRHHDPYYANMNNAIGAGMNTAPSSANIAFPSPIDMGNGRLMFRDDTGQRGWDSFDDHSISLDDPCAIVDMFVSGGGIDNLSASATTFHTADLEEDAAKVPSAATRKKGS